MVYTGLGTICDFMHLLEVLEHNPCGLKEGYCSKQDSLGCWRLMITRKSCTPGMSRDDFFQGNHSLFMSSPSLLSSNLPPQILPHGPLPGQCG